MKRREKYLSFGLAMAFAIFGPVTGASAAGTPAPTTAVVRSETPPPPPPPLEEAPRTVVPTARAVTRPVATTAVAAMAARIAERKERAAVATTAVARPMVQLEPCLICHEPMTNDIVTLRCHSNHKCHGSCIFNWVASPNDNRFKCPVCRALIVALPPQHVVPPVVIQQAAIDRPSWTSMLQVPKWLTVYALNHWGHKDKRASDAALFVQVADVLNTLYWKGSTAVPEGAIAYGKHAAIAAFCNYIEGKPLNSSYNVSLRSLGILLASETGYKFYSLTKEEKKKLFIQTVVAALGIGGTIYVVKKYGAAKVASKLQEVATYVASSAVATAGDLF